MHSIARGIDDGVENFTIKLVPHFVRFIAAIFERFSFLLNENKIGNNGQLIRHFIDWYFLAMFLFIQLRRRKKNSSFWIISASLSHTHTQQSTADSRAIRDFFFCLLRVIFLRSDEMLPRNEIDYTNSIVVARFSHSKNESDFNRVATMRAHTQCILKQIQLLRDACR